MFGFSDCVTEINRSLNPILIPVPCSFFNFVQWTNKCTINWQLSHSYMFRHYCVILSEFVISTLPIYTSMSSAVVGSGVPRGGWGFKPPPPKFRRPSKIVSNSTRLWKLLKTAEFRVPTPQDVRKKGSKILKLPPVRNCFTLTITNKFVVIKNSLRVPKMKKILLYEMIFLVPKYSCLQKPWLGGYRPQISILSVLCPQPNLLSPPSPEQNSWVRHWLLVIQFKIKIFHIGFMV